MISESISAAVSKRGGVGRADLARLVAADAGEKLVDAWAEELGFRRRLEGPSKDRSEGGRGEGQGSDVAASDGRRLEATPAPEEWEPIPFWQPVKAEFHDEELDEAPQPVESDSSILNSRPIRRRDSRPIVEWPRLWRALDDALRSPRPRRRVATDRLVRDWSRGRVVRRLPWAEGLSHARLAILVDDADRLMPYWRDQVEVVSRLARIFGVEGVRLVSSRASGPPDLADDEKLLVLSDLGGLDAEERRERWRRLGRRLARHGGRDRLVALVPGSRGLRGGGSWKEWVILDWEHPDRAGDPGSAAGEEGGEAAVEVLVKLASLALRLEAGLVRDLRRLVPGADVATEAELWAHEDVRDRFAIGVVLDPEAARRNRRDIVEVLPPELIEEALRVLQRWHEGLPSEIGAAEAMGWMADGIPEAMVGGDRIDLARRVSAALAARMEGKGSATRETVSLTDAWFERFEAWAPAEVWRDPRFEHDLGRAHRAFHARRPDRPLPAGASPEMLRPDEDEEPLPPLARYVVRHTGEGLRVFPWDEGYGARLADVEARRPVVVVEDGIGRAAALEAGGGAWKGPTRTTGLSLVTDVETVRLATVEEPNRPPWAAAFGIDEHGIWATLQVDDVKQKCRWIPPGRAWLGSPENEEGRFDRENPPNLETFAEGFWLADTPCTQALWAAVMKEESPSYFQDPLRPVELVTWELGQDFLGRLDLGGEGWEAHLPTELEWEYACRAGSRTATWLGDLEIRGERDAPLLDEVAWYGGNSGVEYDLKKSVDSSDWLQKQYPYEKAGTRRVALKRPNQWGLYDMLGNVYEWTSTEEADGALRVIRGGAWYSLAREVRAAFRDWAPPGYRHQFLGFRFSPGQGSRRLAPGSGSERGTSRSGPDETSAEARSPE